MQSCVEQLHPCLRERISQTYPPTTHGILSTTSASAAAGGGANRSTRRRLDAVLYVPTVLLRYDQNPAFAVACHVANAANLPLVVLAVVPDDSSTPRRRRCDLPLLPLGAASSTTTSNVNRDSSTSSSPMPIALTSRRLALHLEALSSAAPPWSDHGAAVAVRVHGHCHGNGGGGGGGYRTPDHLTLARNCRAVICDEPFVDPYLGLVEKIERACRGGGVECLRVDGSTTVPPAAVLRRRIRSRSGSACSNDDDDDPIRYEGVPAKAWMWQKKTEHGRMGHIRAAMEGIFDAPPLKVRIERDRFFDDDCAATVAGSMGSAPSVSDDSSGVPPVADPTSTMDAASFLANLPPTWRDQSLPAPGVRPWTVSDLVNLTRGDANSGSGSNSNRCDTAPACTGIKSWASSWPGADPTVPPCTQTVGTTKAGMKRWRNWIEDNGLVNYARHRNDPKRPHAPSRMSCYLNLGIVSIFRLMHDVKAAQANKVAGADKYEEEIVKWREMSYAHAFSRTDYAAVGSVPTWSVRYLDRSICTRMSSATTATSYGGYDVESLALGNTPDAKWNAMQRYLINTGELHNNVRMTWGKTVVGWAGHLYHCCGDIAAQQQEGNDGSLISNPPLITATVLKTLCYLNDRYALDGLSPPSYAGLLWCLGWCDKPGPKGGIGPKAAATYKCSVDDFRLAETTLLSKGSGKDRKAATTQISLLDFMKHQPRPKRQRME